MKFEKSTYLALAILTVMASLMFFSAREDSTTMDELAHIPSGYSYLTLRDFRLNPEHPPLIKNLAALPALFLNLNFPTDTKSWLEDVNGQWDQGRIFLYESGNDADKIIFWMRLPEMALALFFGWLFFNWIKKRFGQKTALIALTFYSFSPTFIAHSRYVTTDLAAAFAFFIGIVYFLEFLEKPTWKSVYIAGVIFGIAQLLKFSLVLLIPIYGVLLLTWVVIQPRLGLRDKTFLLAKLVGKTVIIGLIGVLLIWGVYAYNVWNYPTERQFRDSEFILGSFGLKTLVNIDLWMIDQPMLRPLAQYLLGVLMVIQRVAGGNTTYFAGEVSSSGSLLYFPTLYLLKESLAFHLLSLIAFAFALRKVLNVKEKSLLKILSWIRGNFLATSVWIFIFFYWGWSMRSPLNIGVRHLLPTFPFIYILVAKEITYWLEYKAYSDPYTWYGVLKNLYNIYIKAIPKYVVVGILLVWLASGTIIAFPSYLSYYNELAGGTDNGYRYAVDSNYDWGQDLRRLKNFIEENNIEKISVDYFGGGSPRYYLGDRFEPWWSGRGPASGWFAISISTQMGAFGKLVHGFVRKPEDSYEWLKQYQPVAKAGKSIFIYKLP